MAKKYTNEEIEKLVMQEKIKIYELENFRLQNIAKDYWDNFPKCPHPEFSNIIEEINYIINTQLQNRSLISRFKNKYFRKR